MSKQQCIEHPGESLVLACLKCWRMTVVRCSRCGKGVSTPIPEDTVIRAWIECPECLEAKANE